MKDTHYAVVDRDGLCFGLGETPGKAWEDADRWCDEVGYLRLIGCTSKAFKCDDPARQCIEHNGVLCLKSEVES